MKTGTSKQLISSSITASDLPSGSTLYIQNTSSLQTGATFYVSSGTVNSQFIVNSLTASQFVKTGTSKELISSSITSADIPSGSTNYIQLTSTLQSGATFFVSSGTVNNLNVPNTKYFVAGNQIFPILQVQQFTVTTSSGGGSTGGYYDTNITVSITPKFSTSKIIIYLAFSVAIGAGSTCDFTLARNGSNLLATSGFWRGASNYSGHSSYIYYDSPSTTSATAYTLQVNPGAGGVTTEPANETASIIAVELAQ